MEETGMAAHFRWALLIPAVLAGLCAAQQPTAPQADKPREAEVRFADGSVVRVAVLQPSLQVQTRYGKLTIPVEHVRRVDFGLHLSDTARQQIDGAIKRLGSGAYREREQAVRLLAGQGALALPALLQASKSTDLEVAHRAEAALQQIKEKTPEEAQRLREEDVIDTADFPVVGRLATPTIKARTAYFGDVELRLTELRQLRFRGGAGDRDILVDAATHGSASGQWLDTGFEISGHGRLKISAAGQVDLWPQTPGQYLSTPKGYGAVANGSALPGTLLGRIGENGSVFQVGETYEARPTERGKLYLHIVPSPWNNASSGSYRVQVTASLATLGNS
jgi:hypothetical protein